MIPLRLVQWFTMPADPAVFSGTPGVTGLAAHPKGGLLACAMDRRLVLCDLSAKPVEQKPLGPVAAAKHHAWAHENWLHDVAVHGERVATAGYDRLVRLWKWGESKADADLAGHGDWVRVVLFSPDGKTLASAGDDGTARLWDAATGKPLAVLEAGDRYLDALAWSPDGRTLLAAGHDGILRFWDAAGRRLIRSVDIGNRRDIEDEPLNGGFSYPGGARGLAVSPDGKTVAVAGLYSLVLLGVDGKKAGEVAGRAFGCAFSPDGKRLLFSQEKDLVVLDAATRKETHRMKGDQLGLFAMLWLDGKRVAAGGCNGRVGIWEIPA
ncbi:MAG: hypothetical protein K2W96_28605 [Gemmataceae bacterium]|nr:hypothetical protein [Gemmataceae bacterium]